MRKHYLFTLLCFILSTGLFAQTARYQVIHNAADPAAASVDVWLTVASTPSVKLVDDFDFRTATPFDDAPAGVPLQIGIAPGNSTMVTDTIANFNVTLTAGESYVIVANGLVGTTGFAANPDGRPTGFDLLIKTGAKESSAGAPDVDFFVLHGATDAPTVDVRVQGALPPALVNDAAYRDMTPYLTVPAASYPLEVTTSNGETVVKTYDVDLSGLGGGAATVFASGFLDSTMNSNGPAFRLCYALADGTVGFFPENTDARVQVIHNSADPAAETVDVWLSVNGVAGSAPLLDDFSFRDASPFVNAPSGATLSIGIAPSNSMSVNDTIANFDVVLAANEKYVVIANGVLDPMNFAANPDGRATDFGLLIKSGARETALDNNVVSFYVLHGATDAPTVDARVQGSMPPPLVDNAAYTDMTGYLNVPGGAIPLEITTADQSAVVATYNVDLTGLDGQAATVFASGFLAPANNQNGEAFSLCFALGSGTTGCFSTIVNIDEGNLSDQVTVSPNPAAQNARISFDLTASDAVQIQVLDLTGKEMLSQDQGMLNAGGHAIELDLANLPNGMYLVRLTAGTTIQTERLIISR